MLSELPQGLKRAIVISTALHVAVVAAVLIAGAANLRAQKPRLNVLATDLVRLGKKRPEHLLPRKEEPPPPAPQKTVAPQSPAVPKAVTPESQSAKERLRELSKATKVSDALSRLKDQAQEPEGEEDGSPHGTVAKALVANKFASEIYACMKNNYSLEGLSPAQVAARKATIVVRIDAKGRITDADIEQSSGLERFDQNVLRAARRCGHVSPPPAELRQDARDGIGIIFSGS